MLDEAWTAPGTSPLRAQVVRNLARGLKGELEALGGIEGEAAADLLADGALRAADVANLAASSLEDLLEGSVADAVAATHLAAGASRALSALAEAVAVANPGGDHTEYALKDIRSARWRARFAVRQTEEFEEAREQK